MILKYEIQKDDEDLTINQIMQNKLNISNRLRQQIVKNKLIFCNSLSCDTRNFAKNGDVLTIDFNDFEDNSNIVATPMNLDILFEDDWLLVVNKPSGIPIHPSMQHYTNSLSNGVKFYFDTINLHKKIRPVNRLDIGTSGIVIFAKCAYIHECLSVQMQKNIFSKEYLALVHGKLSDDFTTIDLPIARKNDSIIERCVDFECGKKSVTNYKVLNYYENINCSLVNCKLITGRTHQIRVHFSYIGHPLVGDTLYGNSNSASLFDDLPQSSAFDFKRMMLHCYKVSFLHPVTRNKIIINCNIDFFA